jgi:hypothetical protein
VFAEPLCGRREWTILVHYNSADVAPADGHGFCFECLKIYREQRGRAKDFAEGKR